MKTIYKCEVCGKEFGGDGHNDWEKAYNHEKECREFHRPGFNLEEALANAIENADGIKIGCYAFSAAAPYKLTSAKYDPQAKQVNLELKEMLPLEPIVDEPVEKENADAKAEVTSDDQ